ncbi:MAG TPA: pyrroline-5-carboxylate reductase [Xanthobacteraceae bacterium]|nr:pyrroline-5-carboxylate reductase [Xanthobacteraceae bacterium]
MAAQMLHGTVLLVGAGKMGGALLEGWLARGLDPKHIAVRDPAPPPEVAKIIAARKIGRDPDPKTFSPDAIVLAVKPQIAAEAAPSLAPFVQPKSVVISIMAGRTIASLERAFPSAAIVRGMPNTPASIGRGITVAIANKRVDAAKKKLAHDLLAAVGAVEWVDDEALMDAVTAVSGSGPAYLFLLAESLAEAAIAAGLPKDLAIKLARETVTGSGELLHRSQHDAAKLRENVTSPGGTTAAALEVLMDKEGLEALLKKAVAAATKRSRDLAG